MNLFCAGEQIFCEFFALMGAEYTVCSNETDAIQAVSARKTKEELVIISESIIGNSSALLHLINDPQRYIITLPCTLLNNEKEHYESTAESAP